jgi:KipI family sensor histidine kinase inhibitor
MKNYFLSENCFVYNISDKLSIDDNTNILKIYKDIYSDRVFMYKLGIYDIVPAYNSIAFHYKNTDHVLIEKEILTRIKNVNYSIEIESKTHMIDVSYNGLDIENAINLLGITKKELINTHTSAEYHVAMLGFKPYFPYLLGLDKNISLPRLKTPRNHISVGSIGIGGSQTTVFTTDSPSGWNIVGNTNFRAFNQFVPGDKIIFREV